MNSSRSCFESLSMSGKERQVRSPTFWWPACCNEAGNDVRIGYRSETVPASLHPYPARPEALEGRAERR